MALDLSFLDAGILNVLILSQENLVYFMSIEIDSFSTVFMPSL